MSSATVTKEKNRSDFGISFFSQRRKQVTQNLHNEQCSTGPLLLDGVRVEHSKVGFANVAGEKGHDTADWIGEDSTFAFTFGTNRLDGKLHNELRLAESLCLEARRAFHEK